MVKNDKLMKKIMTKPNIQLAMKKYENIFNKDRKRLLSIKENVNKAHAWAILNLVLFTFNILVVPIPVKFLSLINLDFVINVVKFIMTRSSFDESHNFNHLDCINYKFLRMVWQNTILKTIKELLPHTNMFKILINFNCSNKNGSYVNAKRDITKPKGITKYIGRYLAR